MHEVLVIKEEILIEDGSLKNLKVSSSSKMASTTDSCLEHISEALVLKEEPIFPCVCLT